MYIYINRKFIAVQYSVKVSKFRKFKINYERRLNRSQNISIREYYTAGV